MPRQMKRFRLIIALVAVLGLLPTLASAAGLCVTVNVAATSSTQVLAANDLGSGGRHFLCLQIVNTPAAAAGVFANCNIGGAASATSGIQLNSAFIGSATLGSYPANIYCWPPSQLSAKTFPIVPSGAVNCFGTNSTTNVTACDY